MGKNIICDILKENIYKKLFFMASFAAYLCLYFEFSVFSVLILSTIYCLTSGYMLLGKIKIETGKQSFWTLMCILIFEIAGFISFRAIWYPPTRVANLASKFGLTGSQLLNIVGLFGCVVALYSLTVLVCNLFIFLSSNYNKETIVYNIKSNYLFCISGISYFLMCVTYIDFERVISLIACCISLLIFFCFLSPVKNFFTNKHLTPFIKVFSLLTAFGISFTNCHYFVLDADEFFYSQTFAGSIDVIGYLLFFVSIPFLYLYVSYFFTRLKEILIEGCLFNDIKKYEIVLYLLITLVVILFVIILFLNTSAFYGTDYMYDIIYTSDSPMLIRGNVWLNIIHGQNDIRQPLFAMFSAPFMGLLSLFVYLFNSNETIRAILFNIPQIVLLMLGNFMLSKILKFDGLKRVAFVVFIFATYSTILFSVMMEQYVVAYFFLMLCLYEFSCKKSISNFTLFASGGTLLTSMILMPMRSENGLKDKKLIDKMLMSGVGFVSLILLNSRFDIILSLVKKLDGLSGFAGKGISYQDKFKQFTNFVYSIFVYPNAGINTSFSKGISWQLIEPNDINIYGLIIIFICIIITFLNRKKIGAVIAGGWAAFSVLVLFVLGWGTAENGLILYSLYFGWAFVALIFEAIDYITSKIASPKYAFLIMVAISAILLIVNISGFGELVNFAITHYPV